MRRYSGQAATAYGLVMVVAGFALMVLGWRGAAATMSIPTQVAFAVSGSLVGLALVGAGAIVLNAQASRIAAADRDHRMDELLDVAVETLQRLRDDATGSGGEGLRGDDDEDPGGDERS